MRAKNADGRIVDYRRRLQTALEALPPEETADLVEEVESHLAEAAEEGRLDDYLAEIGSPDSFAAGILAERGLLPEPDLVPEAPSWRRLLAALIDAVVAVAPFVLGLVMGLFTVAPSGIDRGLGFALALGAMSLPLIWTVWYWRSRTRRGGRSSAGMTLAGLRPVRIGSKVRIVRRSSMPGDRLKARGVLGSLILLGVASVVVVPILYEVVAFQGRQAAQNRDLAVMAATQDVSGAVTAVSGFGSALAQGADDPEFLAFAVAPNALKSAEALFERSRKGDVGGLVVVQVETPRYESTTDLIVSNATVVVHVLEQNKAGSYRFTVQKQVDSIREGGFSTTYRIVKIESAGP